VWRRHRRSAQHVAIPAASRPTPPPPPTTEHTPTPTGSQSSTYPQKTRSSSSSPYTLQRPCSVGGRHLPDPVDHGQRERPQPLEQPRDARPLNPPIRTFERKALSQASEATFSASPKNLRERAHIRHRQPALTTPQTPHLPSRTFLTTIYSRGPYGR